MQNSNKELFLYFNVCLSVKLDDLSKVQSGGRNIDDSTKVNQQLTLGNRYSSLQDWWKIILGPACFITLRSAVM
jgi:hypothetical protein